MRNWDWMDWVMAAFLAGIGLLLVLLIASIPFVIKDSMEFRERCEAKQGIVITGRDIRLCVVDGKIVDGN